MKILKIFGVVVGIHVFALILIFANPGCSSTQKAAPSPSDTVVKTEEAPAAVSVPAASQPALAGGGDSPVVSVPSNFDPSAPAADSPMVRFSPTRPGTPAAATLEAQPVADVTPASTYSVAKGDSLWTIAKKHHLTVAELAAANNLKAGATVRLGQKLIIPGKPGAGGKVVASEPSVARKPAAESAAATATAPASTSRPSGESVKHVVKPGETLGGIARKYQVRVGEIATANNISDPAKIRPGMELTIPGWQAPAVKAPKTATPAPANNSPVQSAPEGDLDSGLKSKQGEPPVIRVEDPSAPTKV